MQWLVPRRSGVHAFRVESAATFVCEHGENKGIRNDVRKVYGKYNDRVKNSRSEYGDSNDETSIDGVKERGITIERAASRMETVVVKTG